MNSATDITPYLPYSIYYIRLFQILLEMLSLWGKKKEKSHRDAKKKNESSTSKRQTFFSQLEEKETWQGPQTSV